MIKINWPNGLQPTNSTVLKGIDCSGLHTVHVHAVVTLKIGSRFQ